MHDLVNLVNHIRRIHLFHLPTWAAEQHGFQLENWHWAFWKGESMQGENNYNYFILTSCVSQVWR